MLSTKTRTMHVVNESLQCIIIVYPPIGFLLALIRVYFGTHALLIPQPDTNGTAYSGGKRTNDGANINQHAVTEPNANALAIKAFRLVA